MRRLASGAAVLGLLLAACADSDQSSEPEVLLDLPDASPGQIVGLVANDEAGTVEWLDRLDGTIQRLDLDDVDAGSTTIATIEISTVPQQRGLLGQVLVDGRRFASWTQPDTFEFVVGEIVAGSPERIIWSAGPAGSGAIGGVLDERDGQIVLGLGRNTAWDRDTGIGGAVLLLDPDGDIDQQPDVVSVGYTNPWAFAALPNGDIWVADNAAGPDPDDNSVDDIERIGRADLIGDRNDMTRITGPGRAPSSMVPLPDGRIGICGFLDGELRAYEIVDQPGEVAPGAVSTLEPDGTIMPCLTGAAVFADGTLVTVALGDPGLALQILRP